MEGLAVKSDGTYLDGTFGRGGHARGVLQRLGPGGRLLLMDKDPEAIAVAGRGIGGDPRVAIYRGNLAHLPPWDPTAPDLTVVVRDLRVSSTQLAAPARGFTLCKACPTDIPLA